MRCPDLVDIVRSGTTPDPSVLEHIRRCPSCLLDWQIQQGMRYLRHADKNATQPGSNRLEDLNRQVMAQIPLVPRQTDGTISWGQLWLSGLFISLGVFMFLTMNGDAASAISFGGAAMYAVASGIICVLYCWRRDGGGVTQLPLPGGLRGWMRGRRRRR